MLESFDNGPACNSTGEVYISCMHNDLTHATKSNLTFPYPRVLRFTLRRTDYLRKPPIVRVDQEANVTYLPEHCCFQVETVKTFQSHLDSTVAIITSKPLSFPRPVRPMHLPPPLLLPILLLPLVPRTLSIPTTLTILPTAVLLPNGATLTRLAPATTIASTPLSFGSDALVIGTSTIPFPTQAPPVPVATIAGQALAAGAAGVVVGSLGTISNHGPPITLAGGEVLSLGSEGVVAGGGQVSTMIAIPGVQELVSTFIVGGERVVEEYGVIVFSTGGKGKGSARAATGSGIGGVGVVMPTVTPFTGGAGGDRDRVCGLVFIGGVILMAVWGAM